MAELTAKERRAMFAKEKRNPNTIPESVLSCTIPLLSTTKFLPSNFPCLPDHFISSVGKPA